MARRSAATCAPRGPRVSEVVALVCGWYSYVICGRWCKMCINHTPSSPSPIPSPRSSIAPAPAPAHSALLIPSPLLLLMLCFVVVLVLQLLLVSRADCWLLYRHPLRPDFYYACMYMAVCAGSVERVYCMCHPTACSLDCVARRGTRARMLSVSGGASIRLNCGRDT